MIAPSDNARGLDRRDSDAVEAEIPSKSSYRTFSAVAAGPSRRTLASELPDEMYQCFRFRRFAQIRLKPLAERPFLVFFAGIRCERSPGILSPT